MSGLVKDLEAMVNWNDLNPTQDWETMTMTFELDDENIRRITNRLTELGYVKVVRCVECKHLEERVVWQAAGGEASKMYICKSPHSHMKGIARFDGDYYCSEGEPKEDANA